MKKRLKIIYLYLRHLILVVGMFVLMRSYLFLLIDTCWMVDNIDERYHFLIMLIICLYFSWLCYVVSRHIADNIINYFFKRGG